MFGKMYQKKAYAFDLYGGRAGEGGAGDSKRFTHTLSKLRLPKFDESITWIHGVVLMQILNPKTLLMI